LVLARSHDLVSGKNRIWIVSFRELWNMNSPAAAGILARPRLGSTRQGVDDPGGIVEFQDVVRRRRMVRKFTDEPVSEESVRRILRNAVRGPSAGFTQGQVFLVLQGEELARFWEFAATWTYESVKTAPVVIVPFAVKNAYLDRYALSDKGWTDRDEARWPVPYWYIDSGMAALLVLQTAVDEGLGAVLFGIGTETVDRFREEFGVPADHDPIGAIAIGHGDEPAASRGSSPTLRQRRPLTDVVHFGHWTSSDPAQDLPPAVD
jgi:nitroreductase